MNDAKTTVTVYRRGFGWYASRIVGGFHPVEVSQERKLLSLRSFVTRLEDTYTVELGPAALEALREESRREDLR